MGKTWVGVREGAGGGGGGREKEETERWEEVGGWG